MRKLVIVLSILALVTALAGIATADPGVSQTPQTAGISTSTVIIATGVIVATTDLSMYQDESYTAAYNEHTQSVGTGYIEYTKTLNIDTANKLATQSNIEAFKQVNFQGEGAARLLTEENIYVGGSGAGEDTKSRSACFYAAQQSAVIPPFCTSAEAGSSVDMSRGSVTTSSDTRFIMKTMEPGVELNHNIRVIDTRGKVSTFMEVIGLEGRGNGNLGSEIKFRERVSVDGYIALFDKTMHYEGGWKR